MIIGQKRILSEIKYLIKNMRCGHNYNILLRAPSGYGKTTLAIIIAYNVDENNFEYILGNYIDENKRIHILDEIHTIKEPEFLYPYMDSNKHIFILCSNESGSLKEPLKNRCIQLIFDPYTQLEMETMVKEFLMEFSLPHSFISIIASRTKQNPRECKILCTMLGAILKWAKINTINDLDNILTNILSINSNGLNKNDEIYLNFLRDVKKASLQTISSATGLDKALILQEIEPYLLYKGIIKISQRGRELNKYE